MDGAILLVPHGANGTGDPRRRPRLCLSCGWAVTVNDLHSGLPSQQFTGNLTGVRSRRKKWSKPGPPERQVLNFIGRRVCTRLRSTHGHVVETSAWHKSILDPLGECLFGQPTSTPRSPRRKVASRQGRGPVPKISARLSFNGSGLTSQIRIPASLEFAAWSGGIYGHPKERHMRRSARFGQRSRSSPMLWNPAPLRPARGIKRPQRASEISLLNGKCS